MVALQPGQFELRGVVFGTNADPIAIPTGGWARGTYDIRTQDVPSPSGDTILFGRDRLTPAEWSFDLTVSDPVSIRPHLTAFASAWRADDVRRLPGGVCELRFNEHGETFVVYGRPRRLSWVPDEVADPTWRVGVATFQISDPTIYSDYISGISLGLVSTAVGTGVVLPEVLPWVFGQSTNSVRRGVVNIAGTVETPVKITITGPVAGQATGVRLYTSDWQVELSAPVLSGETIVLDTSLGTMTKNGVPVAGVTRKSSLFLRIPPGSTEMTLAATDDTASLTAMVTWRSADALI